MQGLLYTRPTVTADCECITKGCGRTDSIHVVWKSIEEFYVKQMGLPLQHLRSWARLESIRLMSPQP
jgi:hypothetical protein